MSPARKYEPLLQYLEALGPEQPSVMLTFAELEAVVGEPLPASALLGHFWSGGAVAHHNWEAIGFVARLDRLGPTVTFTRQAPRRR